MATRIPGHRKRRQTLTVLSVLNTTKYPPSLLYLLMTLGPAALVLAWAGSLPHWIASPAVHFGRVPLFFYLVHLPLIHLIAVGIASARSEPVRWLFDNPRFRFPDRPIGSGFDLPVVYLIWLIVVLILFPICLWYSRIKQQKQYRWLRFL